MDQITVKDLLQIGVFVFFAGGVFYQVKSQSTKLDNMVGKDAQHDSRHNESEKKIAVLETEVRNQSSWLSKIDGRLNDLFDLIQRNQPKH